MNLSAIENEPRLLLEADLAPLQGTRFQPTGFPDLGAAEYEAQGTRMLLVESAQSMANRLEAVCWDEADNDWVPCLRGLPYVRSTLPDGTQTTSVLEAHRLNSPYIVNSSGFSGEVRPAIGFAENQPFDRRKLAAALLKFDPNSLIHGVFLEKVAGVLRLPRMLSSSIEATGVNEVASGGVKVDRVQPSTGEKTPYGNAKDGYGNVPFHRDEYTAASITAYFNVDLALLRGYGLPEEAQELLLGLALYKIQRVLKVGLRLRTACDLDVREVRVTRPDKFDLPRLEELEGALPALIEKASGSFGSPRVLDVAYGKAK